jgi:molybdopterin molybdotransferase
VRTVAEALEGFRPERRTKVETVDLVDALGRVPAEPLRAPHDLPGFARATVDGYAVRAADTFGASESLPSFLTVAGSVAMGTAAEVDVAPGAAVAIPTGGALPPSADAVVMVEHVQEPLPGSIEVMRPAAPGDGMVRADEDARAGAELVPVGRPLRAQDLGMLAAAGVTRLSVHSRPRVAIVSTGDELVPADAPGSAHALPVGQVRDATAPALAALIREAGGEPEFIGIVPDDRNALTATLRGLLDPQPSTTLRKGSDPVRGLTPQGHMASRWGAEWRRCSDPLRRKAAAEDLPHDLVRAAADRAEPGVARRAFELGVRPHQPQALVLELEVRPLVASLAIVTSRTASAPARWRRRAW